ncbi:hypothetical protein ABN063_03980 [Providencia vermicola]|uniref:hypothetical protein n=1 Tax=Providencia vermicola TaxID=333965 RepID=UPI0032DA945A
MEFKGTPAPWEHNGGSTGFVGNSNGEMVASVYPMHDENAEKMKANAHLIAAAPELLGSLQSLVTVSGLLLGNTCQTELTKARLAIAKALGQ